MNEAIKEWSTMFDFFLDPMVPAYPEPARKHNGHHPGDKEADEAESWDVEANFLFERPKTVDSREPIETGDVKS